MAACHIKKYSEDGMKHCAKCGEWKHPSKDFSAANRNYDGRQHTCKACMASYYSANKDRYRQYGREWQLKKVYGISPGEYSDMLERQGGVCAICKNKCSVYKVLSVDHCHETGANRGLLCNHCNSAIGLLKEDPIIIDAALMYIINHQMRIQDNAK